MSLRLNLGCADRYAPHWWNVDLPDAPVRKDEGVDLAGPLPESWRGEVTHIYAGHLFEHLTLIGGITLATRLAEMAAPAGCVMLAVGPDMVLAHVLASVGQLDTTYHTLGSILCGDHRWRGTEHLCWTDARSVCVILEHAGWIATDLDGMGGLAGLAGNADWPVVDRTPPWQYAIRAYTGSPPAW